MVKIDRINLSNKGYTQFFCPIESNILETLWDMGNMTTSQITEHTNIPLSGVAGTLNRLAKAGYVERNVQKVDGRVRYLYMPTSSRGDVASDLTNRVLDSLVDCFGELALENLSKYTSKK
ncbi:MAG: MarR family transcriptional regulator [ANME-2 cluster archaeon]|jgi:DNA-binding MarR family transcriptional regulator|nr:MarR family transcriptional regulator [ANME-2 cluster archaeon]